MHVVQKNPLSRGVMFREIPLDPPCGNGDLASYSGGCSGPGSARRTYPRCREPSGTSPAGVPAPAGRAGPTDQRQQPPLGTTGTALKPDVAGTGAAGTVGTPIVPPGTTVPPGGQHGRPVVTGRGRQQS